MISLRIILFALMAGLVVPSASAGWAASGSYEPSTTYDEGAFMWPDAPGGETHRVYFNVISKTGTAAAGGGLVNPNVGALSSNFEPVLSEYHEAFLGVWVDCNQDGYIGLAETAAQEYFSELLIDATTCPARIGSPNAWSGAPNYNGWVSEFIPIGNKNTETGDKRVIRDDQAMVWGDIGRPDRLAQGPAPVIPGGIPVLDDLAPTFSPAPAKTGADWNFEFYTASRGAFPVSAVRPGTAGADPALGLKNMGSHWGSTSFTVRPIPHGIALASASPAVEEPNWLTFYASVGVTTLSAYLLPGNSGVYGSSECGSVTGGIQGGWECDRQLWYRYADGSPYPEPRPLARVGQTFDLRDVDCYYGSTQGISTSPTFYLGSPCSEG